MILERCPSKPERSFGQAAVVPDCVCHFKFLSDSLYTTNIRPPANNARGSDESYLLSFVFNAMQ
jgi:hypothetical protein